MTRVPHSRLKRVFTRFGYRLKKYYETEIHHRHLYPNLDTLVDKRLVEKGKLDRMGERLTNTRPSTPAMLDLLREWGYDVDWSIEQSKFFEPGDDQVNGYVGVVGPHPASDDDIPRAKGSATTSGSSFR